MQVMMFVVYVVAVELIRMVIVSVMIKILPLMVKQA